MVTSYQMVTGREFILVTFLDCSYTKLFDGMRQKQQLKIVVNIFVTEIRHSTRRHVKYVTSGTF